MANVLQDMYKQLVGSAPEQARWSPELLSPEQRAVLTRLLGSLEGQTPTPFTGELVADISDLEGLSLEALEQRILQRATGEGAGAEAEGALADLIRGGGETVDFEEFYKSSVRDPLVQEFREMILPEVTRRFGSSGAFGSDRMLAEQQATERLTKTLAGARGELSYRSQTDAANRLLQAIGLAPQVEAGGTEELLKLMQGAALPRTIEQARRTAEYGEFQRQQAERAKRVEQLLAALGLKTRENIATGLGGQRGEIGMQASSTKSALGSIMSDRRLKSDIVLIGVLPSGLNLYHFRYKHDPRLVHFGVMADEVEKLLPQAVILRDDGMKLVDYTMISEAGAL